MLEAVSLLFSFFFVLSSLDQCAFLGRFVHPRFHFFHPDFCSLCRHDLFFFPLACCLPFLIRFFFPFFLSSCRFGPLESFPTFRIFLRSFAGLCISPGFTQGSPFGFSAGGVCLCFRFLQFSEITSFFSVCLCPAFFFSGVDHQVFSVPRRLSVASGSSPPPVCVSPLCAPWCFGGTLLLFFFPCGRPRLFHSALPPPHLFVSHVNSEAVLAVSMRGEGHFFQSTPPSLHVLFSRGRGSSSFFPFFFGFSPVAPSLPPIIWFFAVL